MKQINYYRFIKPLKEVAKKYPFGFTLYLPSLTKVKSGFVIANKETQNRFGDEGLLFCLEFAFKHNRIIGGWIEDGKFYWDAPIVEPDEDIALILMVLHNQIAIFDLEKMISVYNPKYKEEGL